LPPDIFGGGGGGGGGPDAPVSEPGLLPFAGFGDGVTSSGGGEDGTIESAVDVRAEAATKDATDGGVDEADESEGGVDEADESGGGDEDNGGVSAGAAMGVEPESRLTGGGGGEETEEATVGVADGFAIESVMEEDEDDAAIAGDDAAATDEDEEDEAAADDVEPFAAIRLSCDMDAFGTAWIVATI
jgi:hypothetical protein